MATLAVQDKTGKKVGQVDLNPAVFEIEPNEAVVHQVVRSQLASARQGTAATKTRGEVRGGGVKPWRQKGTGRARAGSIRSPLWTGGGVVFGPHPRSYTLRVPRKMRNLALRSALSAKMGAGNLLVIDSFGLAEPSTKSATEVLARLNVEGKVGVLCSPDEETTAMSLRNLPSARVFFTNELNVYDILDNDTLVVTKPALEQITEMLS
ncbi:MAG: 50S ribosomal protein L4 [Actinobacteria bacterium]|nr:MAG: 50S ribosomal protein L4 [Actinomycetota bacterium]